MSLLTLSAKLDRSDGATSWGFRMYGGKDFGTPLTIQRVTPGSLAQKCGVQEGDVITKIGEAPTEYMRHKEAQHIIVNSGNSLELALERGSRAGRGGGAGYGTGAPRQQFTAPRQQFSAAPAPAPPAPAPVSPGAGYTQGRRTPTLVVTPPMRRRPLSPLVLADPSGGGHGYYGSAQSPSRGKQAFSPVRAPRGPVSPLVAYSNGVVNQAAMPRNLRSPNYILAARMTPERAVARAPSPVIRSQSPRAPGMRAPSPTPVSPGNYKDKSPAFNSLYTQMAREPSPVRPSNYKTQNQFGRCPSPTFQHLQDELAWRQKSGIKGPAKLPQFINGREEVLTQNRVVSPRPTMGVSPSMVPACPSPTFQRIERDFPSQPQQPQGRSRPHGRSRAQERCRVGPHSPSPIRNQATLRVMSGDEARSRSRSPSPVITITNHGVPSWAFAPRRRERSRSPAAALTPPIQPRRSQSPTFNELQRQMVEKNAYPLNAPQPAPSNKFVANPVVVQRQRSRSPATGLVAPRPVPIPVPVQRQRSRSPGMYALNPPHNMPSNGMAAQPMPVRRQRSRSPAAGLVALAPPSAPIAAHPQRAQSPIFYDLERQMREKNAYPLNVPPTNGNSRRSRSPTLRAMQRDLAGSPTVTLAAHRSSSPSVRSRPQERRIVRLSSPVPFRKEGSPYRHVVAPTAYSAHVRHVDHNRAAAPFSPGGTSPHVPVAVNKQYNTPINMYSMDNVMESLVTQTSAISVAPPAGGAGGSGGGRDAIPPWQSGGGGHSPRAPAAPAPPAPGGSGAVWKPKIPTGPRKMRTVRAGEARNMPAMTTGRIPVCNACGTAIRGPFVAALDKTWCPDHFMCSNPQCSIPLIGVGFVEEEGQLFCERDYEQFFAPRCGKCGRAIMRECVNALKETFHPDCFLCAQCGQTVGHGAFHLEDGQIYCEKDWQARFQTKCYGCQFPIEPGDRWVEALSQNWHSECFNCSTCQVNLEGQSFFAKGGKPYCKKHASTKHF